MNFGRSLSQGADNQHGSAIRADVACAKLYKARLILPIHCKHGTKVKVMCKDCEAVNIGMVHNLRIGCVGGSYIRPMNGFNSVRGEKRRPPGGKIHVNENFHWILCAGEYDFPILHAPCGIPQSLQNIFPLKVGVIGKQFVN